VDASRPGAACLLALLLLGCPGREATGPAPPSGPAAEGRRLLESGDLEAAAAKLTEAGEDPEALYDLGRVWAKKAEAAPLPTPPPPPSPVPPGWEPPPAPEFKHEELQAVGFFQRAIAARPDHGPAQLALAQLVAPHAIRQHERVAEAKHPPGRRGRKAAPPPQPDLGGVDVSPARVVRSFEAAVQVSPPLEGALEGLIRFADRVGDLDATDRAHREVIKRAGPNRESAEPLVRYGDFLRGVRKDPAAAIEQYRQALIWRPDDDATRGKLADIFIDEGIANYEKQQYATAEARFTDAARFLTDQTSPEAVKVREYRAKLAAIRR
jgi:tetratricopeptide (TPR) repeat protein